MANTSYEFSVKTAAIAAGGTYDIIFSNGANLALFLNRETTFAGTAAQATVYETPTYTGGTAQPSYSQDLVEGLAPRGQIITGATVTVVGTQVSATSYYRGGSGPFFSSALGAARGRRRLKANTKYLLRFTNNDAAAQVLDLYLRWYEGPDNNPGDV